MNKQADQFRQFIEVEVLKIIKKLADDHSSSPERIQSISQRTLDLIKPGMSAEELYRNAVKLDDLHSELAPVVFVIMEAYEKNFSTKSIDEVSNLIKNGNYDDAQHMVKKVLAFKIQG